MVESFVLHLTVESKQTPFIQSIGGDSVRRCSPIGSK
jgi:hypothetical protein